MDIKISFKKLICLALSVFALRSAGRSCLRGLGGCQDEEEGWRRAVLSSSEQWDLCIRGGNHALRRLLLKITESCSITDTYLVLERGRHQLGFYPSFLAEQ